MRVQLGVDRLIPEWFGCIACVGTFDGVHLGHQALLNAAVKEARKFQLPSVVVTFDRHPGAVLYPASCPPALATLDQNLAAFDKSGISLAVILPFDKAMSEVTASDFLQRILKEKLKTERIVVGHDFALGKGREGTAKWLSERIPTTVLHAVELEGERVSSSAIRKAISHGEVGRARALLGHSYSLAGVVVTGQKLGRTLGYPTANIARVDDQLLPKDGIYAGCLKGRFGQYKAAISIGLRPAVGGKFRTVEAYMLDYKGPEIYGEAVELELWLRLRDELDFDSLDSLKAQIAEDVETVAAVPALG